MKKVEELLKGIKTNLTEGKFSKNMIKTVLSIRDKESEKMKYDTVDLIFDELFKKLDILPIQASDFITDFKTIGKAYYKNLYQKFINNAFSVIINYNRFIINQYKYLRTIKEFIDTDTNTNIIKQVSFLN